MLLIHKINVSQIISLCSLIVWLRLVLGRLVDSCDDWMTNVLETLMEVIIRVASTPHDFSYGCQIVSHYYQQQPSS